MNKNIFSLKNLDKEEQKYLEDIVICDGVEKIAVFPDSFTKTKYKKADYKVTIPSSIAIASNLDALYPQFRPRGTCCGMMSVALPLQKEELSKKVLKKILKELTFSVPYYLGYRLRLPLFKSRFDLSRKDFLEVVKKGPKYLQKKYNIHLDNAHEGVELKDAFGSVSDEEIDTYLNPKWFNKRTVRLRYAFGRYFGGNHYAEIQEALEDNNELGVKKGFSDNILKKQRRLVEENHDLGGLVGKMGECIKKGK